MNAREFEDKFKLENFEELEKAFKEGKVFFDNFHGKTTFKEVENQFPVVIYRNLISIMYPAHKIWIMSEETTFEDIVKLISGYETINVDVETEVIDLCSGNKIFTTTIHCMSEDLSTNRLICSKIMKILDEKEIIYERSIEIDYHKVYVEVDEKGNIIGVK